MILLLIGVNVVLVALVVFVRLVNAAHERARKAQIGKGQVIAKPKPPEWRPVSVPPKPLAWDFEAELRKQSLQNQRLDPHAQNLANAYGQPQTLKEVYGTQAIRPDFDAALHQHSDESYAGYKARRAAEQNASAVVLEMESNGMWFPVQREVKSVEAATKLANEIRKHQNITLRVRSGNNIFASWHS